MRAISPSSAPACCVASQLLAQRVEQPAALAVQRREHHRQLELRRPHRELLARLVLGGVCLVDDPVPYRRQDPAHRHHVAEEQRVVGHDDVRAGRAPAHAVQVAQVRVVAAALARAVGLARLHRPAHVAPPVQVHAVQVAPRALARPRQQHRRRCDLVGVRAVLELARQPLELAQTRVVVVALERHVAQLAAQRLVELGQFVVDELVHERVGLGRHAHAHPVLRREERRRHEVRHALPHAGPRLDRQVRAAVERVQDRARHLDLLGALLEAGVHLARDPACRELDRDLLGRRARARDLVGVVHRLGLVGGHAAAADLLEVVDVVAGRRADAGDPVALRPLGARREVADALEHAAVEIGDARQRCPPHRAQRCHVVGRAVCAWCRTVDAPGARRERGAEVGEAVRAQPRHAQPHEDERVEPASRQHALAAHALDEGAVEAAVVRHDVALAHELGELRDGRLGARSAGDHVRHRCR